MSISFVSLAGSTGSSSSGATTRVSSAFDAGAGNCIVVFTSNYDSGGNPEDVNGVTDLAGNTYSYVGGGGGNVNQKIEIWVASDVDAYEDNQVTVTFADNATFALMACAQYSGVALTNSVDGVSESSLTSNGTTHTTQSISTSVTNAVIVGFYVPWSTYVVTGASSPNSYRGSYADAAVVDRIVSGAGSYGVSATSTQSSQSSQACIAVALKEGSGGSSTETEAAMLMGI